MVERRPLLTFVSHAVLIAGVLVIAFPLWVTFVASTLTLEEVLTVPMSLVPGSHFWTTTARCSPPAPRAVRPRRWGRCC